MTAKALHRTVLAVALAALGGSAAAQPTTEPTPTTTPCDPQTMDCDDTNGGSVGGGVNAGAGVDVDGNGVDVNGQINGDVDANGNPTSPSSTTVINPPPPPATNVYVAPAPTYVPPSETTTTTSYYNRYGISVALGGGVEGFTGDTLRNTTDVGGDWNVRVGFGLRSPISFEAAYIGSAQNIDALGLTGNAVLVGNGAQADARLNIPTGAAVRPFVYGGAAWKRYQITNEDSNTSDLNDNDDVIEFPLGVGIGATYSGLNVDLRGEYRIATDEDLMGRTNPDASMDRFGVNASIGMVF